MMRVGKIPPPNKQVLRDIFPSFFYGAKIGVLGLNGAGKSTLLRIIAGLDDGYQGELTFSKGYSVGYLEQEPKLESGKTVRQIVEEGKKEVVAVLREYEEVSDKLGTDVSPEEMEKLLERQGALLEKIEAVNGWGLWAGL